MIINTEKVIQVVFCHVMVKGLYGKNYVSVINKKFSISNNNLKKEHIQLFLKC